MTKREVQEKQLQVVGIKGYINLEHKEAKGLQVYARWQGVHLRLVNQQVYTSVHLA